MQLKVDLLVIPALLGTLAAKQATKTIPIVTVSNADPVAIGLVDSLTRPGGNITGLATLNRDFKRKTARITAEVVPRISHVGVLRDADSQNSTIGFKEYESAARALKIELQSLEVQGPNPDFVYQEALLQQQRRRN